MSRKIKYTLLLVVLCIIAIVIYRGFEHKKIAHNSLENEDHINVFIDSMTIEEKIGQLIFAGIDGTTMTHETRQLIHDYKVGGIILFANNMTSHKQTIELLQQIKNANEQNKLPLFLGVDQEGGRVERLSEEIKKLPAAMRVGEQDNPDLSFEFGKLLSQQVKLYGFNLNFAPVLDINSNPNNPVIGERSFGNTAEMVSQHGIKVMEGIQSENIIPVIKHFPGHGDTDTDSHFELPQVDKNLPELESQELIPFKRAIEAGADMIMTAHILLPHIDPDYPATLSKKVIHDLLREKLNFTGVIITDDMTMQGLTDHFEIGQAAVQSIQAGSDIILVAHEYETIFSVYDALKTAIENDEINEDRLDESLERIIKLKEDYQLGLEVESKIQMESLNQSIEGFLKNNN